MLRDDLVRRGAPALVDCLLSPALQLKDRGQVIEGWDKGLVAGIINGRSSILESLDNTVEVARHLADTVRPRNLYLTSNCELGYLPTGVAEQKVLRLGEAARKAKELVSV